MYDLNLGSIGWLTLCPRYVGFFVMYRKYGMSGAHGRAGMTIWVKRKETQGKQLAQVNAR